MKKKLWFMLFILVFALCLNGCAQQNTAKTDKFTIVTSFYPMYVLTLNVVGNLNEVEVANMTTPQTGCLHDYQLTTKDMKVLERANAFVVNGAGMESFLEKVTNQQPNLHVVTASTGIELLKDSNGTDNPHVWVSISNAITEVKNIADGLAASDPKHASAYRQNAAAYIKKLESQKIHMHQQLDNLSHKDIVTFHEAFPYFAKEFNLNIVTVIEREPGSEPSPRELADLIDLIKKSGTKAMFTEPQYPAKVAQTIVHETGGKIYTLDPVTTSDGQSDASAYERLMDQNLKTLVEALQ